MLNLYIFRLIGIIIAELTTKSIGVEIEIGYAFAKNKSTF